MAVWGITGDDLLYNGLVFFFHILYRQIVFIKEKLGEEIVVFGYGVVSGYFFDNLLNVLVF